MAVEKIYGRVGATLAKWRAEQKLSQQAVSDRVKGMTRTFYSAIEIGRTRVPLHTVVDLARALEKDPAALLRGDKA